MVTHRPTRKALGAFYTDKGVVSFLTGWAMDENCRRVMDPSCGDGRFLLEAATRGAKSVVGCDLDPRALEQSRQRLVGFQGEQELLTSDFFEIDPGGIASVDAIIGNPPFIRYQLFSGRSRQLALASALRVGVRLTRLTSSWAPFLLHAMQFLRKGGRLAMVVPAEIAQTQYGVPTLRAIASNFDSVTLVAFEQNLFQEAQTETMLLLASGFGGRADSVRLVPLRHAEELDKLTFDADGGRAGYDLDVATTGTRIAPGFLSKRERGAWLRLCNHPKLTTLGELGVLTNGYVSGANEFFHTTQMAARDRGYPPDWLLPTARQSRSLRGLEFTLADIAALELSGRPHHLIVPTDGLFSDQEALRRFTSSGELLEVHRRYKCRTRQPWWKVPGLIRADVLFTYMAGTEPRAAVNAANAVYTNTLHGMRVVAGIDSRLVVLAFHSSVALLSMEIEGRSYGGGILKLEPTELARVRLPWPNLAGAALRRLFSRVDAHLRADDYEGAVQEVDEVLLKQQLGLSNSAIQDVRTARQRLVERRVNRTRQR